MSIKIEDKVIVDMSGVHKNGNEEYCHIVFKSFPNNLPIYVDYRHNKLADGKIEYYLTTEIMQESKNGRLKFILKSSSLEQYIQVVNFNNKAKETYYNIDKQFYEYITYLETIVEGSDVLIVDELFKEQFQLLKKVPSLLNTNFIFVDHILVSVKEVGDNLVIKK